MFKSKKQDQKNYNLAEAIAYEVIAKPIAESIHKACLSVLATICVIPLLAAGIIFLISKLF